VLGKWRREERPMRWILEIRVWLAAFPNHPRLHSGGLDLYFCWRYFLLFTFQIVSGIKQQHMDIRTNSPSPPFSNKQKRLTNDVAWAINRVSGSFCHFGFYLGCPTTYGRTINPCDSKHLDNFLSAESPHTSKMGSQKRWSKDHATPTGKRKWLKNKQAANV